jgi:hypothetical protein
MDEHEACACKRDERSVLGQKNEAAPAVYVTVETGVYKLVANVKFVSTSNCRRSKLAFCCTVLNAPILWLYTYK